MRITRRAALMLGGAATAAACTGAASETHTSIPHAEVGLWDVFEASFRGPDTGNPFAEVDFVAEFTQGHRIVLVDGFYDGAGVYKLRFMPDAPGDWNFVTRSTQPELNGRRGAFRAVAAQAGVHGPVKVANGFHFQHADGTPFAPFGTTCYAWIHQSEALQQQTLRTLAAAPFNKLRMCVFPKNYEYNHNEPALYPFERDASGHSDFDRPNPAFFAHLEQRVLDLQRLGIEADLILFHPYDRWGYATMTAAQDDRYLRYVLARLSAFRNVWWSLANEYDLMRAKSTGDFDRFFRIVVQLDPYGHLRSVHYSQAMYDYTKPWVTHASLQTDRFDRAPEFREAWKKPVVFDEVQYEGNLNKRWGNLGGDEMARRFWLGVIHGCYVTHGETMLQIDDAFNESATPTLWWSHGGTLHGTSPRQIAFLRRLVDEALTQPDAMIGFEPAADPYYLNAIVSTRERAPQTVLYFFDTHQPIWYEFPLPAGTFVAEAIDPQACTITPLPGRHSGKTKLRLPVRPFQAVRFRAV